MQRFALTPTLHSRGTRQKRRAPQLCVRPKNMRTLLFILSTLWSCIVFAVDCSSEKSIDKIIACSSAEQKRVEQALNAKYQEILRSVQPLSNAEKEDIEVMQSLIVAQSAWGKFRDADCHARYARNSLRTIAPVIYSRCMYTHAEQRIKDLEVYELQ